MVILREFLYRRDDLVAQFLEQLEGGEYDEERVKDKTGSTSGLGVSAGVGPFTVAGDRRKEGTSETELTVRQTPASRFNRLHAVLTKAEAIQPLESLDDAIWEQIARNDLVEVEAILTLLPGVVEMQQAASIAPLQSLVESIKGLPNELLPKEFNSDEASKMLAQIPVIQGIAEQLITGPVPCTFVPAGTPRYKFFAELTRNAILGEVAELEGEVTALVKVTRKIEKGKPETVGQPIPGVHLNREQRRKGVKGASLTARLQYPAAVVTAIGMYR